MTSRCPKNDDPAGCTAAKHCFVCLVSECPLEALVLNGSENVPSLHFFLCVPEAEDLLVLDKVVTTCFGCTNLRANKMSVHNLSGQLKVKDSAHQSVLVEVVT